MDSDVLKEIENARKEAINGLLKDVGFLDDNVEKTNGGLKENNEDIKQERIKNDIGSDEITGESARDEDYIIKIYRKKNIDEIIDEIKMEKDEIKDDKISLKSIISNLNLIGKIMEKKKTEEDNYYKGIIADTMAKKENLVNRN